MIEDIGNRSALRDAEIKGDPRTPVFVRVGETRETRRDPCKQPPDSTQRRRRV